MSIYSVGILPLIHHVSRDVKQVWYVDDATAAGQLSNLQEVGWLHCHLLFSLLCASILAIRGAQSSAGCFAKPSSVPVDLRGTGLYSALNYLLNTNL